MRTILSDIAKNAGTILLDHFYSLDRNSVIEKSKNDFVSEADKASENYIHEQLKTAFPSINILAEENGFTRLSDKDAMWVIDPLDGTKNFIQSIPYFAISIALVENDQIRVGLVYDPLHKDLFYAEKGVGATRNNTGLKISTTNIESAVLATGFPFKEKKQLENYLNSFQQIFEQVSNIRRCGAAALDLAYVASASYDAFWELGLSPWDMAAGALLIQESGGIVSSFLNENNYLKSGNIIAGNKELHRFLEKITSSCFTKEDLLYV